MQLVLPVAIQLHDQVYQFYGGDSVDMKLETATACPCWYLTGQWTEARSAKPITISCSPFQIGRRQGLSLTLPSPAVSNLHAEFLLAHDALFVRDLHSTNGTFRNGHRISHPVQLDPGDLIRFANVPVRVDRREAAAPLAPPRQTSQGAVVSGLQRVAVNHLDRPADAPQPVGGFDELLRMQSVTPYFQRIISLNDMQVTAYEILARGRMPGLNTPDEMFSAASERNLEAELSHMLRLVGVRHGAKAPRLFINTHDKEIGTFGLIDSLRRFRQANQVQPVTIEFREPVGSDLALLRQLREALSELNIELAYDRFGCGQTSRADLAAVRPDYLKFDMQLIRDIHLAPAAQASLLAHLVRMVQDLGIVPIASGVECEAEHAACRDVGFQLGQGFFYGLPATVAEVLPEAHQHPLLLTPSTPRY